MKIKELEAQLETGVAALIISEINRFYFTEFESSDGFLIVTNKGSTFITDSRYFEAAQGEARDCEVVLQKGGPALFAQLSEILKGYGVFAVAVEASYLSLNQGARYKKELCDFEFIYDGNLDAFISKLREVKTEAEKEKLAEAQKIAEAAYLKLLPMIKPGVYERNLAVEFDYLMRKGGADGISFDTITITGENTSKPHGVPGEVKVKPGDFVTMDFGALYKGYHSDTTRTVAVGYVSDEQKHVYDVVLRAQLEGVAALRAGISAKAADAVCREIITAEGYGDYFGHSTGHGVGAEIHEAPALSPSAKDDVILAPGNVVTIEPGIYLPGRFGVRIEDMLYVTEDGSENFTTLPKELIIL